MSGWRGRAARGLATPHLAEIGLSIHALLWGVGQLITSGVAVSPDGLPAPYNPSRLLTELIGIWPMVTGAVGLWAVIFRKREWRMASSLAVIPVWSMLAAFYSHFEPPLIGGVVTYGMAAVGEAIVYVRVKYRFDRWAEA